MAGSIFFKILSATLIPAVLIFSVLIVVINDVVTSLGENHAETSARESTGYTANLLDAQVASLRKGLLFSSSRVNALHFDNYEETIIQDIIRSLAASSLDDDLAFHAWIALKPGNVSEDWFIYTAVRDVNGEIKSAGEIPREMFEGELRTSEPRYYTSIFTGEPYMEMSDNRISLTEPLYNGGKIVGSIGLEASFARLLTNSAQLELVKSNRAVMLATEDGTIVCSLDDERSAMRIDSYFSVLHASADSSADNGGLSVIPPESDIVASEKVVACLARMTFDGLSGPVYLILEIPVSEYYGDASKALQLIIYSSVIGMILLISFIFFAARNITLPIKQIIFVSEQIASGILDVSFDFVGSVDGADNSSTVSGELAMLKTSLETMVTQLRQNNELKMQRVQAELDKEKALASSNARTRFFANVSHEIRTPMNSILGIAQIMLQNNDLTDKQRKYIGDIKISSDNLLGIINDILDLSKLESGKMKLSPVDYDFRRMMDEINALAAFLTDSKPVKYACEIKGELPVCLLGDNTRLRQIIVNILSNAIKFTDEGSVTLTVSCESGRLRFDVTDTGRGIREKDMEHLFEPFEQFENEGKPRGSGTGLGLPICKDLVEIMDGELLVKSVYGKGSTFSVVIPRIDGDLSKLRADAPRHDIFITNDTKLLIVDDNEINLHVANGLVGALYNVDCDMAQSGAEALQLIKNTDYDIVFMDHMMPDMDGIETTRHIRQMGGRFEKLTIIALTANAVVGMKQVMLDAGMNDFLAKPIDKNELMDIIIKWVPESKQSPYKAGLVKKIETGTRYSDIVQKAGRIVGLDVTVGLDNVAGNQPVFEKSLSILGAKIPEVTKLMSDKVESGDISGFTIQIHGMKSSLASLGIIDLSKTALRLEKAGRDGDISYITDTLPIFNRRLTNLGQALTEIFAAKNGASAVKQPGSEDALRDSLSELREALSNFSFDAAGDIIKRLLEQDFGGDRNDALKRLAHSVESFNYEAIAQTIDGLLASHYGDNI